MNENPGETPNPLGTTPGAEAASTGPTPSAPVAPSETSAAPIEPPVAAEPANRPMEQVPAEPVAAPKKKTGLIAGIIVGIVALVGIGVAAAFAVMNMNRDAVTAAIGKIMSGQAPASTAVDGTIDIAINDEDYPFENIKINLKSGLERETLVNSSSAVVTVSAQKQDDISFEFNEAYTKDGDLYLKLDGAADAIQSINMLYFSAEDDIYEPTDCTIEGEDDEYCVEDVTENVDYDEFNGMLSPYMTILDYVDGEWLRISADEIDEAMGGADTENYVNCLNTFASDLKNNDDAVELYQKYPFIISETEDIKIQKKADPIYRVNIDSENLASFMNSVQDIEPAKNLYSCLDASKNTNISSDSIENALKNIPTIYAEVNGQDNFTRLYLEIKPEDTNITATVDLTFAYPDNLNISEPEDYTDLSEIIQEIMSNMFNYEDEAVNIDPTTQRSAF